MTDEIRSLLNDVQTVYEGKGMVVHPNSFDKLRMEVIKLDNINKQQSEQIEKMKCCSNCKHFNKEDDFEYCWNCERHLVNSLDNLSREEIIKDEWEIKENDR